MNYMYMMFTMFLVLGPILSISSSCWILCWAGMEMGFFALMPLLLMGKTMISKEVALKYFSIQALSSILLYFSGSFLFCISSVKLYATVFFLLSLSLKLGFFPGYFWVPSVTTGLDMVPIAFILGPMKIAPLAFLVNFLGVFSEYEIMVLLLGVISAILGGLLGNNQTNIRAMIGSSSISHTGWMLVASILSQMWSYFIVYLLVLYGFMLCYTKSEPVSSGLMLLSFSGLPPFIMFFVKMNIIYELAMNSFGGMFILLLLSSLFSLIFYLKFSYSLLLSYQKINYMYVKIIILMNVTGCMFLYIFFDS